MGITVAELTPVIAGKAAELRTAIDGLRLPDALVLATAEDVDGQLLTYDAQLTRIARTR